MKLPVCIDFESQAVQPRPDYPPRPVGLAIKYPGKPAKYLSWGHPTKNNCTEADADRALCELWDSDHEVLCHNAKFDLDVAETHFGLAPLPWKRVHDTMFLLFLHDPHATSLRLKPSAERLLGMPPEERDAVRDWLVDHKVIAANQDPGAFIADAPGDLVGKYAIGDVARTLALYKLLLPKFDKLMRVAYDRERRLLPIMLENERQGMRINLQALSLDCVMYEDALTTVESLLRKKLKAPDLNFDDDKGVGDALFKSEIVTDWVWTKGGNGRPPQRSVAKANMGQERFNDAGVFRALDYRNRLHTVLSMSMRPWLAQAGSNGVIYTEWNQTRHTEGSGGGARTGRMSCSRFMNITKKFKGHVHPMAKDLGGRGRALALPPLPLVRKYILPDKGHQWNHRDYIQQEFRIVAHFEDGELKASYLREPKIDYHEKVAELVLATGFEVDRDTAKTGNFADLYGAGVAKLAQSLGVTLEAAGALRSAIRKAVPGVAILRNVLTRMGRAGEPIRTWGGRLYYVEPPRVLKTGARAGQEATFEYKLLNYLIQGSAADCTKEAIIRYHALKRDSRMLVTVHDEINISAPEGSLEGEDEALRTAMESVEFDVPMLSDRKVGASWGTLKETK